MGSSAVGMCVGWYLCRSIRRYERSEFVMMGFLSQAGFQGFFGMAERRKSERDCFWHVYMIGMDKERLRF